MSQLLLFSVTITKYHTSTLQDHTWCVWNCALYDAVCKTTGNTTRKMTILTISAFKQLQRTKILRKNPSLFDPQCNAALLCRWAFLCQFFAVPKIYQNPNLPKYHEVGWRVKTGTDKNGKRRYENHNYDSIPDTMLDLNC